MRNIIILGSLAVLAAGCATTEREAFDPESDPRIGAEVDRACFYPTGGAGGYIEVGGRDAFITGRFNERYLLVFSPGCSSIDNFSSVPVFRNFGDSCRRRGDLVRTFERDFGVTGGCTIEHIYEWDRKSPDDEEADAEASENASETG